MVNNNFDLLLNINENGNRVENYLDYITSDALDALYNLENHSKLEKSTYKGKTIMTHAYGITEAGLKGLKQMAEKHHIELPDNIKNKKLNQLSVDDCRDVAGFIAMTNTKEITDLIDSTNFEDMPIEMRSGFLLNVHATGLNLYKDGLRKENPNSFLYQMKVNGNPYLAALSFLRKDDGTYPEKINGVMKRYLMDFIQAANPGTTFTNNSKYIDENGIERTQENEKAYYERMINSSGFMGSFIKDLEDAANKWEDSKTNQFFMDDRHTPYNYTPIMTKDTRNTIEYGIGNTDYMNEYEKEKAAGEHLKGLADKDIERNQQENGLYLSEYERNLKQEQEKKNEGPLSKFTNWLKQGMNIFGNNSEIDNTPSNSLNNVEDNTNGN